MTALKSVGGDGADAAAGHLVEEAAAADVAHEEDDLDRLDIGAGCDHIHRHDDAGVVAVAEGGQQVLRLRPGGPVGDLPAEVVALAELLADDAHDVVGVAVVLGEDDGLGHVVAAREYLGEELVPKGLDDSPNLVFGNHVPVKLIGGVDQVLLEALPADLPRQPVPPVDVKYPALYRRPLLGNRGSESGRCRSRRSHRSATACSRVYSMTRFCRKKPNVCLEGVAVSPMRKASK